MSREALSLGLTFVLACISAAFFLVMRCEGKGRAFGPRSRRWALLVAVLTGALSTAAVAVLGALGHYVPAALLGLGVVAPSSLCLDRIRDGLPDRRSTYAAAATLWLSWLLTRMDDEMVEDKTRWCEERVDSDWHDDELLLAAHYYHDYLADRMSDGERRRHKIHAMLDSIETRLDITRIIDSGAPKSKIADTLGASRLGREHRYKRNLDDVTRLGGRLRNDAERELVRMLAAAYGCGLYRLPVYAPPPRLGVPGVPAPGVPARRAVGIGDERGIDADSDIDVDADSGVGTEPGIGAGPAWLPRRHP